MKKRTVVALDLGYKKMPISEAILLLQDAQRKGATHVGGMHVQWEQLRK